MATYGNKGAHGSVLLSIITNVLTKVKLCLTSVDYNASTKKLTKTVNGTSTEVADLSGFQDALPTSGTATGTYAVNVSGNAATADSATTASSADIAGSTLSGKILANADLNSYNSVNRNYLCNATDASSVSNRPSGASGAFELEVIRGTGSSCVQIYYGSDDVSFNYIRKYTGNGAWTDWVKLIDSSDSIGPDVSGKADKVTGATAGDVATLDANGNLVDSGKTLGTSVPADAVFTDAKVVQTKNNSSDIEYPLLMAGTTNPNGTATTTRYDEAVTLNTSTNTISANISGNAATATTATSAETATTAASADIASATSSGTILSNADLNSYNSANRNYQCNAANASSVSNRPSGASGAFELEVIRGTGSSCVQVYYSRDDANFNYIRKRTGLNDGTWTSWVKLIDSSDIISPNYSAATLAYDASGESLLFNLSKVSVYGKIFSTSYCQLKIVPKSGSIRTDRSVIKSFNSSFDSFRIYNYPWSSSPGSDVYTPNISYNNNNIGTIDIDLVTTQTVIIHLTVWYIADTAAGVYRFYIVEEVKT